MSHKNFAKVSVVLSGTVLLAGCSGWSYSPPMHGNYPSHSMTNAGVDAGAPPCGRKFRPGIGS
jgi:hypothetical protein